MRIFKLSLKILTFRKCCDFQSLNESVSDCRFDVSATNRPKMPSRPKKKSSRRRRRLGNWMKRRWVEITFIQIEENTNCFLECSITFFPKHFFKKKSITNPPENLKVNKELLNFQDKPYSDPHLPRHPGGVNPKTGEVGGPAGVEPTRYGDWERKGRVTDF